MKTYRINQATRPDEEHPYEELARAIIIQACNDYLDNHRDSSSVH